MFRLDFATEENTFDDRDGERAAATVSDRDGSRPLSMA